MIIFQKPFSFDYTILNLSDNSISFDSLGVLEHTRKVVKVNNCEAYLSRQKIDETYQIFINSYTLRSLCDSSHILKSFIELYQKKYVIDSLFFNSDFVIQSKNVSLNQVMFLNCYKFVFGKSKYLLFLLHDESFSNNFIINYFTLLFDITNKNDIKAFALDFQESVEPYFLGDFNDDKKLDYLYRTAKGDSLLMFTLENNQFRKSEDYFLKLGFNQKGQYFIDLDKSKWFFELK